jgi:glycosyltransferase involved in cell wall biosynthesis
MDAVKNAIHGNKHKWFPKVPIIAFAHHPWNEPQWMNRQQLLSRLGKRGWPVVYSTGALDIWQRKSSIWKISSLFSNYHMQDNVTIFNSGKILPRWKTSPLLDRFAIKFHVDQLKRASGITGNGDFICLCFNPIFWPYIDALKPSIVVFHAYDNYAKQGQWNSERQVELEKLVTRADLITASSKGIANSLPVSGQQKAKVLENGVDTDLFLANTELTCPSDLHLIPHPRIIYTGTINRKVDLPLITHIAKIRPDWHWIMLGRFEKDELIADAYQKQSVNQLSSLTNIHFLGEKSRLEIPSYLANVDVTAMCYRSSGDGWWNDGSPLKMHEYLSSGKPVISSPLETVLPFSKVVAIARTPDEWLVEIQDALVNSGVGTIKARREIASKNSWDERVNLLENWIMQLLKG